MLHTLTKAAVVTTLGSTLVLTACGQEEIKNKVISATKSVKTESTLETSTQGVTTKNIAPSLQHANKALLAKGMYQDTKTGLTWMRCSIGQKWTGKTCIGKVAPMKFSDSEAFLKAYNEQVAFGGFNNWRLPTINELEVLRACSMGHFAHKNPAKKVGGIMLKPTGGIVMEALDKAEINLVPQKCAKKPRSLRNKPEIDSKIFPGVTTKGNGYQTSTKHKTWSPAHTWRMQVGFYTGSVYARTEANGQSFLLVRDSK